MSKLLSVYSGENYDPVGLENATPITLPGGNRNGAWMLDNEDGSVSLITITRILAPVTPEAPAMIRQSEVAKEMKSGGEMTFELDKDLLDLAKGGEHKLHFHADGAILYLKMSVPLDGHKKEHPAFKL